jgi:mRNA interferase MazF
VIRQGDVYWADIRRPVGSAPGYVRPVVVVQNDAFNAGGVRTVLTCPITSNLRRANAPGNVALRAGEANLPEPSVVIVSQVVTFDKESLGEPIGRLPPARVREVVAGLELVIEPRETPA